MKTVLIITYYWPPSGGGGVQRWLKFANYLLEHNIQPVVFTPENPEFPIIDESLVHEIDGRIEIIKRPIWEPYSIYKRFTSRKKEAKIATGFTSEKGKITKAERLSRWIRGNWFIPDARKFWIKPGVKFLSNYIEKNHIDAVISTGPPHSMHLIALGLKRKFNVKWIADFRDPWTNIDYIDELNLTQKSSEKHDRLETEVLEHSDAVITIGNSMKTEFSAKVTAAKIHVIPNGFDSKDFKLSKARASGKFMMSHIGSFSPARNVPTLWKALGELVRENEEFSKQFEFQAIGQVDQSITAEIQRNGLENNYSEIPYLPHDEVLDKMMSSSVLLLSVNNTRNAKGILTGKIFEYLKTNRSILAIGPGDGDLADLLEKVNAKTVLDYNNLHGMKSRILEDFELYLKGKLEVSYSSIDQFDRRELTKELVTIINSVIQNN